MRVEEVMSAEPACCTSSTSLEDVAKLMVDWDCGEIPVVDSEDGRKPIGVITDRDIVCRAVARGINPLSMNAADCMTEPCVTVSPETPVDLCCRILEENRIRRVPVVDSEGRICGIVAVADLARHAQPGMTADVMREVSEPSVDASTVTQ